MPVLVDGKPVEVDTRPPALTAANFLPATELSEELKANREKAEKRAAAFVVGFPYTRKSTWDPYREVWRVESAGVKSREDRTCYVKVAFRNMDTAERVVFAEDDVLFKDFVKLSI